MNKDEIRILVVGANIDYITDEVLMEVLGASSKSNLEKWAQKLDDALINKGNFACQWNKQCFDLLVSRPPFEYKEHVKLDELFFDKDVKKYCKFLEELIDLIVYQPEIEEVRAAIISLIGHFYDYRDINYGGYIDGFKYSFNDPRLGNASFVINVYLAYVTGYGIVPGRFYAPSNAPQSEITKYA